MMDLHEWMTFGNTIRTHQGAEGPPRERPSLPLFFFTLKYLFARCERALWRHVLATQEEKQLQVKASAEPVQDLVKADIIGGGDVHTTPIHKQRNYHLNEGKNGGMLEWGNKKSTNTK